MEKNDHDLLVAICYEARQRRSQCHAEEAREQLTIGKVFRSKSHSITETFSFIWLSHLRAGQHASKRTRRTQMATMLQAQGVPRAITQPRKVSGPGAQPAHWSHVATFSHQVR